MRKGFKNAEEVKAQLSPLNRSGACGLSGNWRGEAVNMGCWAGEARPTPHIFPYITVIPNEPAFGLSGALEEAV
jgi:hypothetical protein